MKNWVLVLFSIFSLQIFFAQGEDVYEIGDFKQGGIVFWLEDSGKHGLVCAKEDFSELLPWDTEFASLHEGMNSPTPNNSIVLSLGDGAYSGGMNTTIIIAALGFAKGKAYAASACNELKVVENEIVYGDWYLPSREELNWIYKNRKLIDKVALENGGDTFFQSDNQREVGNYYWSSTESWDRKDKTSVVDHSAWGHNFKKGGKSFQLPARKYMPCSVRAIRSF